MATKTMRAPYVVGDKFKALFYDPKYGTCLGVFTVTSCRQLDALDADQHRQWEVVGVHGETRLTRNVRADGTDRDGYTERA